MTPNGKRSNGVRPEDFYLMKGISDPQVSPDGGRVAYVVSWPDKEENETQMAVYVAPARGGSQPRRFSQGKKDHSPRWSPDGRYLAFVAERGEKNQLWLAPLDGGEARELTNAEHGVSQPAWSPDSRRLAYVARVGPYKDAKDRDPLEKAEPRVIRDLRYKLDGVGFFDERPTHIFTVDVESGKATQVTEGDWNDDQPAWSADGKWLAFISDREKERHQRQWRSDVWVVASMGGAARKLTGSNGSAAHPTFSPDGRMVAFVGHEHGEAGLAKNMQLMAVSARGGEAPRSVSEPIDRPVAGWPVFMSGRTFDWTPDSGGLLFLAGDRGRQALYRAGLNNGSITKVADGERQIEGFALFPGGERVAFCAVWLTEPAEVYVTSLTGRARETNISRANSEVREKVKRARLERMTYVAADGLQVEAFVLYPPGYRAGKRYPLSVNVHGGPHSFHPGSRSWLEFHSLTARGYVVLLPNPRGSTTYGEAFSEACVRDWGGRDYADIMAGVDKLVEDGVADPERLYIGGYSYGGFMASWAVGHTDRFRAAVVGAPVSDQVSMFGTGDIPLFDMFETGGTPQENPAEYAARSPITYLGNVRTPVLLVHHEGDLRCPIGQSEEIFHALKVRGVEVEFVRYPGGFHTYNTHLPSQTVDRTGRVVEWYELHQPKTQRRRVTRKRSAAARVRASSAG